MNWRDCRPSLVIHQTVHVDKLHSPLFGIVHHGRNDRQLPHLFLIVLRETKRCQDDLQCLFTFTLVSASDNTPTGRPQSIHWPFDAYCTQTCNLRIITKLQSVATQLPGLGTVFLSVLRKQNCSFSQNLPSKWHQIFNSFTFYFYAFSRRFISKLTYKRQAKAIVK